MARARAAAAGELEIRIPTMDRGRPRYLAISLDTWERVQADPDAAGDDVVTFEQSDTEQARDWVENEFGAPALVVMLTGAQAEALDRALDRSGRLGHEREVAHVIRRGRPVSGVHTMQRGWAETRRP
jgi:hypothetical protein